jgi:predicted ATPase
MADTPTPGDFLLVEDNWDDWFTYETKYHLHYCDADGNLVEIGAIKIGQFDMKKGQRRPNIPEKFKSLGEEFFSVGQRKSYYKALQELNVTDQALKDLRDIAYNNDLFRKARNEDVFETSLLRSVKETTVLGEYARIISGAAPLTPYDFRYRGPAQLSAEHEPIELSFKVTPESDPPSNIHVLIGRNGIGKSFMLNAMVRALVMDGADEGSDGKFFVEENLLEEDGFSSVISVSFSAFDKFEPLSERMVPKNGIGYAYVGLKKKKRSQSDDPGLKDISSLSREFSISALNCLDEGKLTRWQRALDMLESDPIFKIAKISELAEISDIEEFKKVASSRFRNLSSGHKIVLLTVTRLVELVVERSLVLLDEPEAHLHPPLLSAFIRSLSDLLNNRNGVAIVATHSPVVLQEVPANCTWLLERHHTLMTAERPSAETFAENVGILTHRIFGLEVEEAGFFNLIRDAVLSYGDYGDIMEKYGGSIGSEGRGLIRSLIAVQNQRLKE